MPEAVSVPPEIGVVPATFRVAELPLVSVPAPARAVETVSVPLLVTVPEIVRLGIVIVPVIVLDEPDIV